MIGVPASTRVPSLTSTRRTTPAAGALTTMMSPVCSSACGERHAANAMQAKMERAENAHALSCCREHAECFTRCASWTIVDVCRGVGRKRARRGLCAERVSVKRALFELARVCAHGDVIDFECVAGGALEIRDGFV